MIQSFELKNFKCWINNEINFSPLTILAGSNAAGKSSVIQGLLFMESISKLSNSDEISTDNIGDLNLGLPKYIISKDNISNSIELNINYTNGSDSVTLTVGDEITLPHSFNINKKEHNKGFKSFFLNFQYLNAERIGPRITSDIRSASDLNVGNRGQYTPHTIHTASLMKLPINPIMIASKIANFTANCESWLDIIIPGTQISVNYYEAVNKASIKFKNSKTSSDSYVPTATGFGLTYVLPIIVSGLILSSQENSLLIVENPEAHLHPYSQSKIGQFLALLSTCGVQVIIETHSEHVINGVRLQLAKEDKTDNLKINFFSSDNNEVSIEELEINEYGELEKWPTGFFDQNKADLRELLEMRICKK